jgi:hypothetical protein
MSEVSDGFRRIEPPNVRTNTSEQVLRVDREAQRLMVSFIEPAQPKLVHVRDNPPCHEDGIGREHSASGIAQVVKTLTHGQAIVPLALLRHVKLGTDILELTENPRNRFFSSFRNSPMARSADPAPPLSPAPGIENFGQRVKTPASETSWPLCW